MVNITSILKKFTNVLSTIYINLEGGQYPSEISWIIQDSEGTELVGDGVPISSMQYCLDPSACYSLLMYDSYGDGWNGYILEISGEGFENNQYTLADGWSGLASIGNNCEPIIEEIDNCIDDTACNYNPEASEDDGSCTYAEDYYDCSGACLVDTDSEGIKSLNYSQLIPLLLLQSNDLERKIEELKNNN